MQSPLDRRPLWPILFLSGAAGLIYQVAWQKYLAILLGAEVRATAIVIAIFLAGVSLGYFLFGNYARRAGARLLAAYALVELGLGVWALLFPMLFRGALALTGHLYTAWGVDSLATDVLTAALLIGPPTVLMGGTLPLLTQAMSEGLEGASRTHAAVYGLNTVGAGLGSLAAGYVLIPNLSLPVTVAGAGGINLVAAALIYAIYLRPRGKHTLLRDLDAEARAVAPPPPPALPSPGLSAWPLLLVAFLSGFYVIALETILIRVAGLATGASEYNFCLILSIVVLALGLGSLAARRIERSRESRLFWNQMLIAAALLALYVCADSWPYWVHRIRIVFRDQAENFYLYHACLGLFFAGMLAVPLGLCGMTLPYCFHLAKDRREWLGLRVGQLYAINTVGCVLGALVGGYLALNYLNLDELWRVAIGLVLLSAVVAGYLTQQNTRSAFLDAAAAGVSFGLLLVGVSVARPFNKMTFIQPFRQQNVIPSVSYAGKAAFIDYLSSASRYLFYKDGPNTTVGVGQTRINGEENSRTIFVNGKSDGNTHGDSLTMTMTAHIPGLLAPHLDKVCVVGFGTGLTIGGLARYQEVSSIDVVEISGTVLEAAPFFDNYDGQLSINPKIHIHQMDALRFLSAPVPRYDVLVSEPSNPWVAGVENLYSREFYRAVKRSLKPEGVFVQWVQTYSFNDDLFRLALRTFTEEFPTVSVFQMLDHDVALVAWPHELTAQEMGATATRLFSNPGVRHSLEEIGINRFEDLLAFELIPPALTRQIPGAGPVQTLERPRLGHEATRAFFVGSSAHVHTLRRGLKEYYPSVSQLLLPRYREGAAPDAELADSLRVTFCENPSHRSPALCQEALIMAKWLNPGSPYEALYGDFFSDTNSRDVASLLTHLPPNRFTHGDLMLVQRGFDFFKEHYSAIAQLPIEPLIEKLDSCLEWIEASDPLHGDCLLQKAAILEITSPEDPDFPRTIQQYLDWFAKYPKGGEDYTRFERARELLKQIGTR
jgi:predicted membrane-bound spermidine synthase